MPDQLTPAEKAAFDALLDNDDHCSDFQYHITPELARAVVAAVRPIIAAEALREVAAELRLKAPEPGTLFFVDADGLERRAEDRLAACRAGEGER